MQDEASEVRYRRLSPSGDYQFGQQQADFWRDQPEAVAQAVQTRLRLELGDWFLDTTDGTDWRGSVLGNRTAFTRDAVIRSRVLLTPGVKAILGYNSRVNPDTRAFSAGMSLDTIYGRFVIEAQVFLAPEGVTQHPPSRPINVTVQVLSQTSAQVTWSIT
jgi:hypothetical protein